MENVIGVWRSLVARFVRDEEAVGSNPATPTILRFRVRENHEWQAVAKVVQSWPIRLILGADRLETRRLRPDFA